MSLPADMDAMSEMGIQAYLQERMNMTSDMTVR